MKEEGGIMKLTIAICTYNRAELLKHALAALTRQTVSSDVFELLVIDNNSPDQTQACAQSFAENFTHFRVILETNQGLSYARNRAMHEASTDWILYLDDDAKAKEDLVEKTLDVIQKSDYQIFGGVFYPWYLYGKPHWYKDTYASNVLHYRQLTSCLIICYVTGGVFV
ncbi:MAG: glycosyltransferase family 2 protein [Saprospiraceae bacterium]